MNESLIHATEWVNFENTMLSKTSQRQRTTIICFHLHEVPNKQTHKDRKNNRSYQGLRKGEVGVIVPQTQSLYLGWASLVKRSPGEGNGYPLQYSCLANSMDRGAWWATVHGVAKSQTQLCN